MRDVRSHREVGSFFSRVRPYFWEGATLALVYNLASIRITCVVCFTYIGGCCFDRVLLLFHVHIIVFEMAFPQAPINTGVSCCCSFHRSIWYLLSCVCIYLIVLH